MVKIPNPLFSQRSMKSERLFSPRRARSTRRIIIVLFYTCLFLLRDLRALRGIALFSSLNSDQFIFDFNVHGLAPSEVRLPEPEWLCFYSFPVALKMMKKRVPMTVAKNRPPSNQ